jgi:hypothetical protein
MWSSDATVRVLGFVPCSANRPWQKMAYYFLNIIINDCQAYQATDLTVKLTDTSDTDLTPQKRLNDPKSANL